MEGFAAAEKAAAAKAIEEDELEAQRLGRRRKQLGAAMARDADRRSAGRGPSVLRGDRQPTWGCQRSTLDKRACRIKHRCGRSTPDKFAQKAKRSLAEGGEGRAAIERPERRAASWTRAAPANSEERKEVEFLGKEGTKPQPKAQAAPQPPPEDDDVAI